MADDRHTWRQGCAPADANWTLQIEQAIGPNMDIIRKMKVLEAVLQVDETTLVHADVLPDLCSKKSQQI
ncbi:MAG: hypothetical protein ACK4RW_12215 [Rehaibacterium terrae]|uniref:hypothetical protein n=1 Tax=Rehaibacterium terrae TaxID=1341696 RepID=UPI00391C1F9E